MKLKAVAASQQNFMQGGGSDHAAPQHGPGKLGGAPAAG